MIKNLPENLKLQRETLGISQKDLAAKLGVSPSVISAYETGERTPSVGVLLSLSYTLKVSVDHLLGKSDENTININVSGLSQEQISALLTLVETMRKE